MVIKLNTLNPLKLQNLGEGADMDEEELDEEELDEESDEKSDKESKEEKDEGDFLE